MNRTTRTTCKTASRAFTLVELVVVILILGTLAAITVPKIVFKTETATDNGLRKTLRVIRDAIDLYEVEYGVLPGATFETAASFKNELNPQIRGPFPAGPVGPAKGDNRVRIKDDGDPLSGAGNPNRAWKYDIITGEFIYNYNGVSSDGVTKYDEF